jgi:hydroxymethylglutaryl-CoA lyase
MTLPDNSRESIRITEVGPRDGLQNERVTVSSAAKIAFIEALVDAGVKDVEVTSFVDPKRVPAMADAEVVYAGVQRRPDVRYLALVGNMHGYRRACSVGCDAVAIFAAASEGFNRANIGASLNESFVRYQEIATQARLDGVEMRAYVSTIFACPYDGSVSPEVVHRVTSRFLELGCYEVSLADTTGAGTPSDVRRLLDVVQRDLPTEKLALHFHDTWGMGAANTVAGVEHGVRHFDSSAGGLGGCPFAPGASGNIATEDLVYLFHRLGFDTGVDLTKIIAASQGIGGHLDHPLPSRVHQASLASRSVSPCDNVVSGDDDVAE